MFVCFFEIEPVFLFLVLFCLCNDCTMYLLVFSFFSFLLLLLLLSPLAIYLDGMAQKDAYVGDSLSMASQTTVTHNIVPISPQLPQSAFGIVSAQANDLDTDHKTEDVYDNAGSVIIVCRGCKYGTFVRHWKENNCNTTRNQLRRISKRMISNSRSNNSKTKKKILCTLWMQLGV